MHMLNGETSNSEAKSNLTNMAEKDIGADDRDIKEEEDDDTEEVEEDDTEEEDIVDYLLRRENEVVNAGLNSRLPSRIMHHEWLLRVCNTAINAIDITGEYFGVKTMQIIIYTTIIYVDRFLSLMPIQMRG